MSFGSNLKALRESQGMTQLKLAEKINLSRANISKYEADLVEPNLSTLVKISALFNVSIDSLLDVSVDNKDSYNFIPHNIKRIISSLSGLSDDEIKKIMEYIEFVKSKQKH